MIKTGKIILTTKFFYFFVTFRVLFPYSLVDLKRIGGIHWPKTGATYNHAQLGLPIKDCELKWLIHNREATL